jgi:hypothetical protein
MAPGWSSQCDCEGATGRKVTDGKRENDNWILNRYGAIVQTAALIADLGASTQIWRSERRENTTRHCHATYKFVMWRVTSNGTGLRCTMMKIDCNDLQE